MDARTTQLIGARRTEYANRGGIDPADKLFGVVKAFNQRKLEREYDSAASASLFDAVKAFNTRRLA